jgi:hypothetical protein
LQLLSRRLAHVHNLLSCTSVADSNVYTGGCTNRVYTNVILLNYNTNFVFNVVYVYMRVHQNCGSLNTGQGGNGQSGNGGATDDSCAPGCDITLHEQVLELREKRYDRVLYLTGVLYLSDVLAFVHARTFSDRHAMCQCC